MGSGPDETFEYHHKVKVLRLGREFDKHRYHTYTQGSCISQELRRCGFVLLTDHA